MADDPTTGGAQPTDTAPPPPVPATDPVNAQSQALAAAAVLAEKQHTDDGEEGGHYIVNGVHVNANGDPIKKSAKASKDGQ